MKRFRCCREIAFFIAAMLVTPRAVTAHDLPTDVLVQAFVKPSSSRLHLAVRVPLKALRDIDYPEQRNTGYLDVDKLEPLLADAIQVWISDFVDLYEGSRLLPKPDLTAMRLALASDRSFASFDAAMEHLQHGPKLTNRDKLVWHQTDLDLLFEYPIASDRSTFSIHPRFDHLATNVVTVMRFVSPQGTERAYQLEGDPGLVALDPSWSQAAWRFIRLGFDHILDGTDHILFVLCLVMPLRRLRSLVAVITAFTVAHSVTLMAAAFDLGPQAQWFPSLIETLIAASIVFMALENIIGVSVTGARRWVLAFVFGLVHGFGFSFLLKQTLQFAGSHLLLSLVSFNLGVELGQVFLLLLFVPLLGLVFRHVVAERMGIIIGSAFVAHTAWHWMTERGEQFLQYPITWPTADAATTAFAMRWLAALLLMSGVLRWLVKMSRARERAESSAGVET